jgi:hypothetical protein
MFSVLLFSPYRDSSLSQVSFCLRYGKSPVMKYAGGKNGVSLAQYQRLVQVLQISGAAAGDNRYVDSFADSAGQLQIVSRPVPIGVPAGKQDLASAERSGFLSPVNCIDTCRPATAVSANLPLRFPVTVTPLGVNGDNDTLRTESTRAFFNNLGIKNGSGIYAYFVSACLQHAPHIVDAPQAAADSQRNKYLLRATLYNINHSVPSLGRGAYIQKDQLIGTFSIVKCGQLNRVAGIAEVGKTGALDHPAFGYIETGDNPFR